MPSKASLKSKNILPITEGGTGKTSMGAGSVGTVTQSAGIPTGAIVESGSNASGSYTKWADGTMICIIRNAGPFAIGANAATVVGPFALPTGFISTDFFASAVAIPATNNDVFGVISSYAVTQTSVSFVFRNGATAQNIVNIKILCVGRWF